MMITRQFSVQIHPTRDEMGAAAARDAAAAIKRLLQTQDAVSVIFAAAPSQDEFYRSFRDDATVDFTRVHAFHMDEYIGLSADAPQGFGNLLKERLFSHCPFRSLHFLQGNAEDSEAECRRYSALLEEYAPDIVCLGIGENGHIAFNDPAVADFHDTRLVKVVELDERCRRQQVNDGCFRELSEVPTHALTLTIPALVRAKHHFCMVPSARKAEAVRNALMGGLEERCPASVLRTCADVRLYLDQDSASLLPYGRGL